MDITSPGTLSPRGYARKCGEPFFEAREVDLIQNALRDLDRESAALISPTSSVPKP